MDGPFAFALLAMFALLIGVLLGSWITWRASNHQSPIPTLPRPVEVTGAGDDKPVEPRKAKL